MVINGVILSLTIRSGVSAANKPYSIASARVRDPDYRDPYWITLGREVTKDLVDLFDRGEFSRGRDPVASIIVRSHYSKQDKAYLSGNLITIDDRTIVDILSAAVPKPRM